MIYPYITVTTLAEIGIVPAYNLAIACWSAGIAITTHVARDAPDHESRRFTTMLRVHAFACLPCVPFGSIIGTWCYVMAKGTSMDEIKTKTAIFSSILSMFYATNGAISAFLLAIPSVLVHQYQDLIYPYSVIVTQPLFAIFGAYGLALIVGDIIISIACISRKFSPFDEQVGTSRFAKFLRAWAMLHILAIPVGPFLATFFDNATGRKKKSDRQVQTC